MKDFRLLICLVTYDRLAYTKTTLKYLWDNTSDNADYFLVVVDNASTDGTQEYLKQVQKRGRINMLILNPENYYPGKACNIGWTEALKIYAPTHLMRLDNDMELKQNWDLVAKAYFKTIPELGQLGLEHEAIEDPKAEAYRQTIHGMEVNTFIGTVGGPMIMKYELWDKGICYDETPWNKLAKGIPSMQEDSKLSTEIKNKGYLVAHSQVELGRTFATRDTWKAYPEYYKKTMTQRGYEYLLEEEGL